jgi:hypothetical protein
MPSTRRSCQISMKLDFLARFSKNKIIITFRSVEAELFHADRRTDGRKDTRTYRHHVSASNTDSFFG